MGGIRKGLLWEGDACVAIVWLGPISTRREHSGIDAHMQKLCLSESKEQQAKQHISCGFGEASGGMV